MAEELKRIRDIANDTASHYKQKYMQTTQMQLMILQNDDGTYEFIEQKRVVSGYESSKLMLRQNDPRKTKWDLIIIFLAIYNSF